VTQPTVVMADDHRVVAEGLRRVIESDFEVLATVEDGEQLVETVAELRPDLVVADVSMPRMTGIEALRRIRDNDPQARVVLLTMHGDETYAATALECGARGYILKHCEPDALLAALRSVMEGQVFISPELVGDNLTAALEERGRVRDLSPRQREILRLIAKGRSHKQVAADLGISIKTVEYHKYRIMEQLGVRTTAELVRLEVEHETGEG
jgi:DNA-binding NarL/FixJ family response regulator